MAVETKVQQQGTPAARPKREREQELLVWPDLVFVEFICAVVITLSFVVLSFWLNAPLLNRANLNVTPNPSKAPWYFMNLQEMLLHMHPALAGVVVPTIAGKNAVKITIFAFVFTSVVTSALVLYDQSRHVNVVTNIVQHWDKDWEWPEELVMFRNVRAIQTEWQWSVPVPESWQLGGGGEIEHDGSLDWPEDFSHVPMPFNGTSGPEWMQWGPPDQFPGWVQAMYWYDLNMNTPAFIVEHVVPVTMMVGLPILMCLIMWKMGLIYDTRSTMIALFTGFMTVFWVLTIVGAGFRGAGQDLVLPWSVPKPEG
jgi:hypothetical protein